MSKYLVEDNFYYPGTQIPKNKLSIKNCDLLDEIEKQALDWLYINHLEKIPNKFSASYICKLHNKLFGKIYEWGGVYRNVDISKGKTRFANCRFIPELMNDWEKMNNDFNRVENNKKSFAVILSKVAIEFNAIHPFREGNGRIIRFVLDQMAIVAGYKEIWGNVKFSKKFEKNYILASEKGVNEKDYDLMAKIISQNLKIS